MKTKLGARLAVAAIALGVALSASAQTAAQPKNVVIDIADHHAHTIVLKHNEVLWLVARKSYLTNKGWPRFVGCWGAVKTKGIFRQVFLVDGLSPDEAKHFGLKPDEVPIGVYPVEKSGTTDITVNYKPLDASGAKPHSDVVHVRVK